MNKSVDQLPDFQTHPTCIKCGNRGMFLNEVAESKYFEMKDSAGIMRRTCKNCGFTWIEKTLDYSQK